MSEFKMSFEFDLDEILLQYGVLYSFMAGCTFKNCDTVVRTSK